MDIKIRKVSELDSANTHVIDGDDIFYFVRNVDMVYESFNITLSDTFLSTTYLDDAWFCSDTLIVSDTEVNAIANTVLNGSMVIDGNVSSNACYGNNYIIDTCNTNTLTATSNTSFPGVEITANNIGFNSFLDIYENNLNIEESVDIDCGINRVGNVSDPIEDLDALNLLYFNEHVFNCTGALVTFPTNNQPRGWLSCNGQIVSRSTYNDLWQFANSSGYLASSEAAKTNVEFGPGNGSTTFSLPNISCCSATATSNSSFDYINIMLVIDVSGSMQGEKLTNAKIAAKNLIQEYENNVSDVRAIVVEFSTDTANSAWIDQSNANTYIDSMPTIAMSGTYYDQSLIKAMDVFVTSGKLSGNIKNVCYFLSDGNPTSSSIPTDTEIQTWLDFLIDNEIDTYAIGIGSGISLTYLNPIAYDGINNSDRDGEIVTNPENLSDSLISTVNYEYSYSYSIPSYIKT